MQNAHSKEKQKRSLLDQDNHANDQNQQRTITTTLIFKQERPCNPKILRIVNIPGWAATVIKQAVLLLGCCDLHFLQRLGSTRSFLGRVHSRIFGSGGKMRLRVDPPFSLYSKKKNRERQEKILKWHRLASRTAVFCFLEFCCHGMPINAGRFHFRTISKNKNAAADNCGQKLFFGLSGPRQCRRKIGYAKVGCDWTWIELAVFDWIELRIELCRLKWTRLNRFWVAFFLKFDNPFQGLVRFW